MGLRHMLTLLLTITAASAVDVEINCIYKSDQTVWTVIATKFTVCELDTDLKPSDTIKTAIGTPGTVANTAVKIFISNEKKVLQIPDGLKSVFTGLEGIKFDSTEFKFLDSDKLKAVTGLKYLAITNSKIDVIFENTFKDLQLELIDFTGSPIMFISSRVLEGPGTALKYLFLDEVLCIYDTTPSSATDSDGVNALIAEVNSKCVNSKNLETSLFSTTRDLLATSNSSEECEPCTDENDCPTENDCSKELKEINLQLNSTEKELNVCKTNTSALKADVLKLQQKIDELEALTSDTGDGTCSFKNVSNVYSCYAKISVKTAADQTVKWNGTHVSGKKDSSVLSMVIYGQTVEILPLNIGSTFTNIKYLTVKNSGLTKIKSGDFKNLAKLETLEISGNNITTIDATAFAELIKLKELDLSANRIIALPSKVFETLSVLSILNLSDNSMKIRYDIISATNAISEVYLMNNGAIKPLDRTFIWRLQKASKIDLTGTGCDYSLDKLVKPETFMAFYSNIVSNC